MVEAAGSLRLSAAGFRLALFPDTEGHYRSNEEGLARNDRDQ
jgi:hypothetical protein